MQMIDILAYVMAAIFQFGAIAMICLASHIIN